MSKGTKYKKNWGYGKNIHRKLRALNVLIMGGKRVRKIKKHLIKNLGKGTLLPLP